MHELGDESAATITQMVSLNTAIQRFASDAATQRELIERAGEPLGVLRESLRAIGPSMASLSTTALKLTGGSPSGDPSLAQGIQSLDDGRTVVESYSEAVTVLAARCKEFSRLFVTIDHIAAHTDTVVQLAANGVAGVGGNTATGDDVRRLAAWAVAETDHLACQIDAFRMQLAQVSGTLCPDGDEAERAETKPRPPETESSARGAVAETMPPAQDGRCAVYDAPPGESLSPAAGAVPAPASSPAPGARAGVPGAAEQSAMKRDDAGASMAGLPGRSVSSAPRAREPGAPAPCAGSKTTIMTREVLATLAPLPLTILKVLQALEDPDTSMREAADIAGRDVALAAHLLRIANSAMYGMRRRIGNIGDALTIIGTSQARIVVLSWGLSRLGQTPVDIYGLPRGAFVRHSETVATLTTAIARDRSYPSAGLAYCAGLLHDIGKVALNAAAKRADIKVEPFQSTLDAGHQTVDDLLDVERASFATTHATVSQQIAELWSLPEEIGVALASHHQVFTAGDGSLAACVALANAIAAQADERYPACQRPPLPMDPALPLQPLFELARAGGTKSRRPEAT